MKLKIAIIGGGAAGMMVAGKLAAFGFEPVLFEKNEKLGKKLYITGKGRCNITNYCSEIEFLDNVVNNTKFLYSAIYAYTPQYIVDLFNKLGLKTKIERGKRVFPESDKSSDVISTLKNYCINNGVIVKLNEQVLSIQNNDAFYLKTNLNNYKFDVVVIATGGKTYKLTGSDGSGYLIAEQLGHSIVKPVPGLVPILLSDNFIQDLEGISLKNVNLIAKKNNKLFKSLFGEMLFTHNGISGPIVLTMSSYINREVKTDIDLFIDFKPALTHEKLILRIQRDIETFENKQISSLIMSLLPKNMTTIFLKICKIDKNRKCKTLNLKEIETIVSNLKNFKLSYNGTYDLDFGIITSGGVNTKEINPKTLESKICKNLYFAGEVIDVDALTGGYNLQIAWSTANLVADSIIFKENL